jgi:murein DD-endopeptidase MepM/ murein hydrolase activator NlpD
VADGRDDGAAVAEQRSAAEGAENGDGSFDPGLETGYLRRAPRDHELEVDLGAAPFEPGPGTGFDNRRARRAQKRREKDERKRRERDERADRKRIERERAEAARAKLAADQAERERAGREQDQVRLAEEERVRRRQAEDEELDRRERAEKLRLKRERSRRQHDERAERMHERRRQMEKTAPGPAPKPEVVAVPAPAKAPPPAVRPIRSHSLKRPTLKAVLSLVAIIATGIAAGALLGLPLPSLGSDSDPGSSDASLASGSLAPLDSGTPASLTEGPFLPIIGPIDYGQKDARFGAARTGHTHEGQDMFAKPGTTEVAVRNGVVVDRGKVNGRYSGGRGNYLVIYSPLDDRSFVYMHMLHPSPLFIGDDVTAGQPVGQLGCTGTCFGPHLHFEIRIGKATLRSHTKPLDPLPYLRQWPQAPTPAAAAPPAQAAPGK